MNNIKALRKEQGISVTELAAKLNMSQSNLTKIENNQIELKSDTAAKIAESLGVAVQAITTKQTAAAGMTQLPLLNPETLQLPPLSRLAIPSYMQPFSTEDTALFAMEDDTMSPKIPASALVLIDRKEKTLKNGIYLIKINNQLMLRRLQTTFSERVKLLCDNPAYPPQLIDISLIERIGKALSFLSITPL